MTAQTINRVVLPLGCMLILHCMGALGLDAAAGQGHPMPVSPVMKPMTLTAAQVDGFFAAVGELRAFGDKKSAWKGADPSKPMAMAQALQVSDETTAILSKHGFANHTEFQRVAYNASMAYAVLKEGGKETMRKKLDASKAEQERAMAKLKDRLTPEQLAMLSGKLNDALQALSIMQDVPDQNVVLMKKYRDRMAKLGTK